MGNIIGNPIAFKGFEVKAILEGKKTQTRRVVDRIARIGRVTEFHQSDTPGYDWIMRDKRSLWNDLRHAELLARCPYGQPGDRLWVRETWRGREQFPPAGNYAEKIKVEYCAGGDRWFEKGEWVSPAKLEYGDKWKSSIHMPRWASRINLEITSLRVESLQDISEEDAIAEGVDLNDWYTSGNPNEKPYRHAFMQLWDRINAKTHPWSSNPWVWVLEFRRVV